MNREESFAALSYYGNGTRRIFTMGTIGEGLGVGLLVSSYEADYFNICLSREAERCIAIVGLAVVTPMLLREFVLATKAFSLKRQLKSNSEAYIEGSRSEFERNMNLRNMNKIKVYGKNNR